MDKPKDENEKAKVAEVESEPVETEKQKAVDIFLEKIGVQYHEKLLAWRFDAQIKLEKYKDEIRNEIDQNKSFTIIMKLLTHYSQSLSQVFTYSIPYTA